MNKACLEKRGLTLEKEYGTTAKAIAVCVSGDTTATATSGCPNAGKWVDAFVKKLEDSKCNDCSSFGAGKPCTSLVKTMQTGTNAMCWELRARSIYEKFPALNEAARCAKSEVSSKERCYSQRGDCITDISAAEKDNGGTCKNLGSCAKGITCCFFDAPAPVYDDWTKKTTELQNTFTSGSITKDDLCSKVDCTDSRVTEAATGAAMVAFNKCASAVSTPEEKGKCAISSLANTGGLVDKRDIAKKVYIEAENKCRQKGTESQGSCADIGKVAMSEAGLASTMADDGTVVAIDSTKMWVNDAADKTSSILNACIKTSDCEKSVTADAKTACKN